VDLAGGLEDVGHYFGLQGVQDVAWLLDRCRGGRVVVELQFLEEDFEHVDRPVHEFVDGAVVAEGDVLIEVLVERLVQTDLNVLQVGKVDIPDVQVVDFEVVF